MLSKEEILNIIEMLENKIVIIKLNDYITFPRKSSIIENLYCAIELLNLEYDNA
jgi:hypothetical protein